MARAVTCRSSEGVVMTEEQCDQSLRPLAIYPCGDRDCAPHWVEQEWQQVQNSVNLFPLQLHQKKENVVFKRLRSYETNLFAFILLF